MTRKVHGAAAGPWLGSNTVVFSISGALVPLIALVTSRLLTQCAILAAVTGIGTIMLYLAPSPGNLPDPAAAFEPKQRPVVRFCARCCLCCDVLVASLEVFAVEN